MISINSKGIEPSKLEQVIEETEFASRANNRGIINSNTNSSISIADNGDIDLSSSAYSQYKISGNGSTSEISLQSNTITNLKNITTDSIAINRHKLNPALWELTDFKQIDGTNEKIVGNLNMNGTVLVKAWEPNLKKYVLIRRPLRMPIFSTTLNVPDMPSNIKGDDIKSIEQDLIDYLLKKKEEAEKNKKTEKEQNKK